MKKETREQINERMKEWNQRTKERKKGRKIIKGITFLDCQFTKRTNNNKKKGWKQRLKG